ncbi:hypothetical protein OCU04_008368 [Sclerotinia nivalis]|uniref:Ankyrin repeat protein n=1 Tax=Sclerotinia nivalis TaxID=352851 RepID=A0A9X0AHX4_9HELO|nr:hypothetical protein OCU04_008368 [Sclerotinia nivalis]
MKRLFNLWLKDKAHKEDVSTSDEGSSDEGPSDVEEYEAKIPTDEGEDRNDGSSVVDIDEGNTSSIRLDFENTSSIVEVDVNDVSPLMEPTEQKYPMAKTEDAALDEILEESDQSPGMDERKDTDLYLLSGSHESTDFGKLRLLLAQNPDLEIRNGKNFTPLAISIRTKNLRAMYALLIARTDIKSHINHGQTCLHLACCLGNEIAVAALLDAGANTSTRMIMGA